MATLIPQTKGVNRCQPRAVSRSVLDASTFRHKRRGGKSPEHRDKKSPRGKRGRRVISFERSSSSQTNDTTIVAGNCSTL